jgi:hypothetical protein
MGISSVVYVSIPDSSSSCANLGLPSLPSGWSYNCVTSSSLRKVDGSGWVPTNFTSISWGTPVPNLPIDPQNTTSTGQYYTYVVGGSWELTTLFESDKYSAKASTLTPGIRDKGLVGYWKFEEGSGTTAYDSSGNGNNGTWSGTGTHYTTGKVGSYSGQFATTTSDYVVTPTSNLFAFSGDFTLSGWFYIPQLPSTYFVYKASATSGGLSALIGPNRFSVGKSLISENVIISYTPPTSQWFYLVFVRSGATVYCYYNGTQIGSGTFTWSYPAGNTIIGIDGNYASYPFNGLIDDVRIYNRALSSAEISAIYNATR